MSKLKAKIDEMLGMSRSDNHTDELSRSRKLEHEVNKAIATDPNLSQKTKDLSASGKTVDAYNNAKTELPKAPVAPKAPEATNENNDDDDLTNLFRSFIKDIDETPENEAILNQVFTLLKKLR